MIVNISGFKTQFLNNARLRFNNKTLWTLVFIAPTVIFLITFSIIPIFFGGWVSLHNWNMVTPIPLMEWVGLDNFKYILKRDTVYLAALRNTFIFTGVGVAANTFLGLIGALLLNSKIYFKTLWRTIYFLPIVTAPLALGMMWSFLLNKNYGLVNRILSIFGIPPQPFMASPDTALGTIILIAVYQSVGYYIVIFLAGLQSIPMEYYDAAAVDGANSRQSFWHITLPLLRPVMLFLIVTNTIGALQVFDIVFAMTDNTNWGGGGPANSTVTVVLYAYMTAFKFFKMGRASAMAVVLFAIILVMTLLQLKLIQKRD